MHRLIFFLFFFFFAQVKIFLPGKGQRSQARTLREAALEGIAVMFLARSLAAAAHPFPPAPIASSSQSTALCSLARCNGEVSARRPSLHSSRQRPSRETHQGAGFSASRPGAPSGTGRFPLGRGRRLPPSRRGSRHPSRPAAATRGGDTGVGPSWLSRRGSRAKTESLGRFRERCRKGNNERGPGAINSCWSPCSRGGIARGPCHHAEASVSNCTISLLPSPEIQAVLLGDESSPWAVPTSEPCAMLRGPAWSSSAGTWGSRPPASEGEKP